jgi:histidinol-phosphate phosphatase family protein
MKRILAIRLGAIGDVILTSAPILNLKLSFPDSEIFLLTRRHLAELADLMPGVDKTLPVPRKISLRDLFRLGEVLDEIDYDMIFDWHGNFRSYYLSTHISASDKLRYRKRRLERLSAVKFNKLTASPPHTIDLYNETVRQAGGKTYSRRPVIKLNDKFNQKLVFDNDRPVIAIAPGASYPPKQWPREKYISLAISLYNEFNCNLVLFLTSRDRECEKVRDKVPSDNLQIFIDNPLYDLAHLLTGCDLLICNDSGLAHLGSAVGTPVMAIFGPTHPTLGFTPRGLFDVVVQVDEFCRPCSLHGKKACYREKQYCFDKIAVEDLLEIAAGKIKSEVGGQKTLFIDRDGTLIKEKNFLKNPDDVEPINGSIEAIKSARAQGFKIIVVSNQSGVARGYFDEKTVRKVNQKVIDIFRENGAVIDDIYYCPYLDGAPLREYDRDSMYRKPAPGMAEEAARKYNINLSESYVIGDKLSDLHFAYVIGGRGIIVRTGYGSKTEQYLKKPFQLRPEKIVENLREGVQSIAGS